MNKHTKKNPNAVAILDWENGGTQSIGINCWLSKYGPCPTSVVYGNKLLTRQKWLTVLFLMIESADQLMGGVCQIFFSVSKISGLGLTQQASESPLYNFIAASWLGCKGWPLNIIHALVVLLVIFGPSTYMKCFDNYCEYFCEGSHLF